MRISFMSANYVAARTGFHMTEGWSEGARTTNDYFRPIETFDRRFDELLDTVRGMGFDAIDLWDAHLSWTWATDEHVAIARDSLAQHGLGVPSLAGGFGSNLAEFEAACRLAANLGVRTLGGSTSIVDTDRPDAVALLDRYDLLLALENHPHLPTPEDMKRAIGDGAGGRIGTVVDTGWYGTYEYDAAEAIRQLRSSVLHVHLKDVRAPGAHDTCRYGEGCVPIEACVRELQDMGYSGAISVEHEPETFDPTEDCKANLAMLRSWLAS